MKRGESMHLREIKYINEALSLSKPPPHTLFTLITCITTPLLSLGVNGLHDLTNRSRTHILFIHFQSKHPKVSAKRKVALNRLAALVNFPPTIDLTAAVIHDILRNKNPFTLSAYRKINNAHISGFEHTHLSCPPNPTFTTNTGPPNPPNSFKHPQQKWFPAPNHAPQPTSQTHSLDAAYPIHQPN